MKCEHTHLNFGVWRQRDNEQVVLFCFSQDFGIEQTYKVKQETGVIGSDDIIATITNLVSQMIDRSAFADEASQQRSIERAARASESLARAEADLRKVGKPLIEVFGYGD
jgi:hypothetical protein